MSTDLYRHVFAWENTPSHHPLMDYPNILREIMRVGKIKQDVLAKRLKVQQPSVSRWLQGNTEPKGKNHQKIVDEAERLGIFRNDDAADETSNVDLKPQPLVRVVGYVGAGSEAHYYALSQGDLEEVDAPKGATEQTAAVEIKGESLGPLFDHWLVFFDEVRRPVTTDLIGELCVVGLSDDRVLIKKIKNGRRGLYRLISATEEPIEDVMIEWAAKVKLMTPRGSVSV